MANKVDLAHLQQIADAMAGGTNNAVRYVTVNSMLSRSGSAGPGPQRSRIHILYISSTFTSEFRLQTFLVMMRMKTGTKSRQWNYVN